MTETQLKKRQKLVSWCFEPSQPQRITSRLNTNFTLSPSYSFHKSSYHKSCFGAYLYSADTQHGNLPPAGWPILLCGPTQETYVSHSQHRKNRERFWKKCRWMNRTGRYKQTMVWSSKGPGNGAIRVWYSLLKVDAVFLWQQQQLTENIPLNWQWFCIHEQWTLSLCFWRETKGIHLHFL